jgi:hypothetical protein
MALLPHPSAAWRNFSDWLTGRGDRGEIAALLSGLGTRDGHARWDEGKGLKVASTGSAVVTGAGSGLGRAISRALLTAGWRVALAGRREEALRETLTPGDWQADSGHVVPTDVTLPESVAALFAAVGERWGRLDLLVNNAGVFGPAGALTRSPCLSGARSSTLT